MFAKKIWNKVFEILEHLSYYFMSLLQNDYFYMEPAFEYQGHQLPGGKVKLSPHHKWLSTYGTDGKVMLRTIGQMVSCVFLSLLLCS